MSERLFYARRSFQYDEDLDLDQGQCFNPRGLELPDGRSADERLERLGYMEEYRAKDRPLQCGKCGAAFINDAALNQHGNKRHSGRDLGRVTPTRDGRIAEDVALEAELKRENAIAPLYLDKTEGKPIKTIKRGPGRPRVHP